ncbi:MAG: hypothetical protein ACE37D_01470 [Pseudomonadales bacterium]|jgi:NADH:ubiquinone oxidoreductase subunit E
MQRLFVCTNIRKTGGQPSCGGRGSLDLIPLLESKIAARGLACEVKASVCFGHCERGPNVKPLGAAFYHGVTAAHLDQILDSLD